MGAVSRASRIPGYSHSQQRLRIGRDLTSDISSEMTICLLVNSLRLQPLISNVLACRKFMPDYNAFKPDSSKSEINIAS